VKELAMASRFSMIAAWALLALAPVSLKAQAPVTVDGREAGTGTRLLLENGELRAHLITVAAGNTFDLAAVKPHLVVLLTRTARASLSQSGPMVALGIEQPVAWSNVPFRSLRSTEGGPAQLLAIELRRDAPLGKGPRADNHATRVAPDIYQLIFENDRVRVIDVHILPGQASGMHTHSGMDFRYPLTSGRLKLVEGDGKATEVVLRAGTPRWEEPPSRHTMQNVGTTELQIALVELK
jgi:quercetin dioxygenase-like cupin family protein